jgi:adenylate cyclase
LAVGDAVAGNLGSQDRMEFTIIGPTVNLASRLESLTKVVQSNFVVSLEVLHSLPEELRNEFEESDGLDIRGFSGKQRVGVFRSNRLSLKAAA